MPLLGDYNIYTYQSTIAIFCGGHGNSMSNKIVGVGGIKAGGVAQLSPRRLIPVGGLVFSGAATTQKGKLKGRYTASGGIKIGGPSNALSPDYGAIFIEFNDAVGLPSNNYIPDHKTMLYRKVPCTEVLEGTCLKFARISEYGRHHLVSKFTPGGTYTNTAKFTFACKFRLGSEFFYNYVESLDAEIFAVEDGEASELWTADYQSFFRIQIYKTGLYDGFYFHIHASPYFGNNWDVYTDVVANDLSLNDYTEYRLVVHIDVDNATESERVKIWFNGDLQIIDSGSNYPAQGERPFVEEEGYGTFTYMTLGDYALWTGHFSWEAQPFHGHLRQIYFIDNDLVSDSDLYGSGVYMGEYGGGGFYLEPDGGDYPTITDPMKGNSFTAEIPAEDINYYYPVAVENLYSLTNLSVNTQAFTFSTMIDYTTGASPYWDSILTTLRDPLEDVFRGAMSIDIAEDGTIDIYSYDWYYNLRFDVYTTNPLPTTNTKLTIAYDSGNSVEASRIRIFFDDIEEVLTGDFPVRYSPYTMEYGRPIYYVIGSSSTVISVENGYDLAATLRNTIFVDGTPMFPSDITPTFYGPYGIGGWHLKYPSQTIGKDSSPNQLDFTNYYDNVENTCVDTYNTGFSIVLPLSMSPASSEVTLGVSFRLYSGESVTSIVNFELIVGGSDLSVPFVLYGSGTAVTEVVQFNLYNTDEKDDLVSLKVPSATGFNTGNFIYGGTSGATAYINYIDYPNGYIYISLIQDGEFDPSETLYERLTRYGSNTGTSTTNEEVVPPTTDYAVWSWGCVLDGVDVSSKLIDEVAIESEEDASSIATFTLAPSSGSIDPLVYVGKSVSLSWSMATVATKNKFSGWVADVEWDPDRKVIRITADTQLPAQFNAMAKDAILALIGGTWSDQVWADEDDKSGWTFAQEVLSTTENCIWQDENRTIHVSSLLANRSDPANIRSSIVPHYTFTDDHRFHESLRLEYAQRSEMLNTINIALSYEYQRKRHREITFKWDDIPAGPGGACQFLVPCNISGYGAFQLCQKSMVTQAASSGSWVAISPITFTEVWDPGGYMCTNPCGSGTGGSLSDFYVWNITTVSGFVNGEEVSTDPATGEQTTNEGFAYEAAVNATHLCIGASWRAATRWAQTVTENYDIVVKAPDSIEAVGPVVTTEEYSIRNDVEITDWNDSLTPFETPDTSGMLTFDSSKDKYINVDEEAVEGAVTREDFLAAQEVILAAAKGDIIRSHRLTTVSFTIPYKPDLNLSHTVKIETSNLVAAGKVKALKDVWSVETGEASTEVTIAISRHNGSGTIDVSDTIESIGRPEPTEEEYIPPVVDLDTHIGGRDYCAVYDEEAQETWQGFLTNYLDSFQPADFSANKVDNPQIAQRTYPYTFIVRGPTIEQSHTDSKVVAASNVYQVAIPEDTLTLSA